MSLPALDLDVAIVRGSDTEAVASAASRRPSQFPLPARLNFRRQAELTFAAGAVTARSWPNADDEVAAFGPAGLHSRL